MLNDAKVKAAKAKEIAYKLGDSGQLHLYVTPASGRCRRRLCRSDPIRR
jgi:hypothetical protein